MSGSHRVRYTSLLISGVLLVALVAPGAALALVGEPVPGAEVFLQQQPGDDPIHYNPTDGADHSVNPTCNISWAPGTFATSGVMTATVGYSPIGIRAFDGALINTIVSIQYSGPALLKPVKLTFACPPGSIKGDIYLITGTGTSQQTQSASGTRNGNIVVSDIKHFSIYGVGGDVPVTSTPASSTWSLAAFALVGVALGGFVLRRSTRKATGVCV